MQWPFKSFPSLLAFSSMSFTLNYLILLTSIINMGLVSSTIFPKRFSYLFDMMFMLNFNYDIKSSLVSILEIVFYQ